MKKQLLTLVAVMMTAIMPVLAADVEVKLDADFSVLTEGTEAAPVAIGYADLAKLVPEVYNSSLSVTAKAFQAGGSLLLTDGGKVQFNSVAGLTYNSVVRISIELKMGDSYGGAITVATGSYTSDKSKMIVVEGDEWQTVTFYSSDYRSSSRMVISPFLSANGVYIKNVKMELSSDFIVPTTAYLPNDADGTQFTASWAKASSGSGYELDVYSYNGNEKEYVLQADAISSLYTTSKKVTGLDPAKTYFYVVRVKGSNDVVSDNSNEVEVIKCITSIDAPEALDATNVSATGFTANWTAVENAIGYNVNVYSSQTFSTEHEASVLNEDFSGVNIGTVSSIDFGTGRTLDEFTKSPGWLIDYSKAFAAGYYVIYPSSSTGFVATPAIDLSRSNGTFTVKVNAACGGLGSFYVTSNTIKADLVEGDDLDNLTVIEEGEAKTFGTKEFTDYVWNFTKGTSASRILITYTHGDDNTYKLYIDGIDVRQTLPAGSVIEQRIASKHVENGTSADFEIDIDDNITYSYDVTALAETVVGSGSSAELGTIESKLSNRIKVSTGAGFDNVAADEDAVKAWKAGEGVLGVNGSAVTVYDITGRILYNNMLPADVHTLNINVRGLVIVRVDGKACKVVL